MSKTKITGWLIFAIAVLKMVVDALDGNGFDVANHWESITAALAGAGLVFLRSGVDKASGK